MESKQIFLLDNVDGDFLEILFKIIYDSCTFEYIEVNDVKYAQAKTKCYSKNSEHQQPSECPGYMSHTDDQNGENDEENHSPEYDSPLPEGASVIFGISKALNVSEFPFDDYETESAFFEGISLLTTFQSSKQIVLQNRNGFNKDHRGSDHFKFAIPQQVKVVLGTEFTIDQLIDALYRIKSHHTDNWYELFCGVKIIENGNEKLLVCDFDHGS